MNWNWYNVTLFISQILLDIIKDIFCGKNVFDRVLIFFIYIRKVRIIYLLKNFNVSH